MLNLDADQGTKVGEFIRDFFSSYKVIHYTILIPLIIFLIYYIFIDRFVTKNIKRNSEFTLIQKIYIEVVTVVIIIILSSAYYATIRLDNFKNKLQTESNYGLWLYPENSNLTVNNFGVLMFGFCDLKASILHIDADYVMNLNLNKSVIENKENNNEVVPVDLERKIDDTSWKELISKTNDGTFKSLNNYFINRSITPKNDMTGKFKDKNLIIIMMESVNEIAIYNEEYFPTLYKMYHEGISFKNNYSPRNNCSTGNNEFTVLSSLFTINNTCTANTYASNKYPEAVFNIFNNAGYKTSAYHD